MFWQNHNVNYVFDHLKKKNAFFFSLQAKWKTPCRLKDPLVRSRNLSLFSLYGAFISSAVICEQQIISISEETKVPLNSYGRALFFPENPRCINRQAYVWPGKPAKALTDAYNCTPVGYFECFFLLHTLMLTAQKIYDTSVIPEKISGISPIMSANISIPPLPLAFFL